MEDWIRKVFDKSSLPKYVTFEEFKKKGYFVVPPPNPDRKRTVSNRWYYEGRECDVPDHKNPQIGTARGEDDGNAQRKDRIRFRVPERAFPRG